MKGGKVILIFGLLMLAGLFHIIFTMFDHGFNDPDSGGFTLLQEQINETLTGDYKDTAYERNTMLKEFFGIGRVIIVGMCVLIIAYMLFDRDSSGN